MQFSHLFLSIFHLSTSFAWLCIATCVWWNSFIMFKIIYNVCINLFFEYLIILIIDNFILNIFRLITNINLNSSRWRYIFFRIICYLTKSRRLWAWSLSIHLKSRVFKYNVVFLSVDTSVNTCPNICFKLSQCFKWIKHWILLIVYFLALLLIKMTRFKMWFVSECFIFFK